MTASATGKQARFAIWLLYCHGYSIDNMSPKFQALGATPEQCRGGVRDWLAGMSRNECSALIDKLKRTPSPHTNEVTSPPVPASTKKPIR
jgi:hypothetical protein